MEFIEIKKNNWALKGNLTFDAVQNFNWEQSIDLDLSGVKDLDTSLLALIFEWKRLAKEKKQNILITGIPKNLTKLARLYGAQEFISNARNK